jgi:hypothetical protein
MFFQAAQNVCEAATQLLSLMAGNDNAIVPNFEKKLHRPYQQIKIRDRSRKGKMSSS